MSEQVRQAEMLAVCIAKALGEQHLGTRYLASGSTSTVYKVTTSHSDYILKVARPHTGKVASFESDFHLRETLWKESLPIARPIATNRSLELSTDEIRVDETWAIDEFRMGSPPVRGRIPQQISQQLGTVLQVMHDIPVSGYGRLENSTDKLTGSAQSAEVGLQMRYEAPWPFTFESLDDHPTVRALPSLKPKIHRMESDLLSFGQGSKPAINHSDLHEGQLLVSADSLTALLDFNDAFVGRREWDLGSYLYFHGSKCLGDLLDGYCRSTDDRSSLTDQAALASVLIALHHGNRGAILGRPHRIEASVKYLSGMFL